MEHVQEVFQSGNKQMVTFSLTLPPHVHSADLIGYLRRERAEKRKLGHDVAAEAISSILSLAKTSFYSLGRC